MVLKCDRPDYPLARERTPWVLIIGAEPLCTVAGEYGLGYLPI